MRVRDILSGSTLPRADTEVLLARLLRRERTWLLAHDDAELSRAELRTWAEWQERLSRHEPVATITEQTEFYGRPFLVRRGVLIPRPSTEGLIETALAWLHAPSDSVVPIDMSIVAYARVLQSNKKPTTIVDVGTGSGVIAISLALEHPDLRVIATDISDAALDVAKDNARLHSVSDRITFLKGSFLDLVADLREPFLLVSNPPYVPSGRQLPKDIMEHEPREAIFAGPNGLDVLRPLIEAAREHPFCAGFVVECEEQQVSSLEVLLLR